MSEEMEQGLPRDAARSPGSSARAEPPPPRVDIALTAYKRADYIRESIESVLKQTLGEWRLRICENGRGDDEIARVVSEYLDDRRISHHPAGRDLALAENWTRALRLGEAPYVSLLNDDDRWHPEYLEARINALDSEKQCGFAFAEWLEVDEEGRVTNVAPVWAPEGVISTRDAAEVFIRTNPVVPSSVVIRRAACEEVGAFFDGNWKFCDWELWARLAARFPVFYLARQDNDFRRHSQADTFTQRESPEQLLAMVSHIETLFAREVGGFELSRYARAKVRSQILLRTATDAHMGNGWSASGGMYSRAIREYPPSFFTHLSLVLVAKSLLGRRGSQLVARALRPLRSRSTRGIMPPSTSAQLSPKGREGERAT